MDMPKDLVDLIVQLVASAIVLGIGIKIVLAIAAI